MNNLIFETKIVRGLSDRKKRTLKFFENGIEFDNSTFFRERIQFIEYNSIKAYRFGIEWITGLYFTFGREYIIELKTNENEIIKLNFSCYYGFKKQKLAIKQNEILDALWELYIEKICFKNIESIENVETIKILKTYLNIEGIESKKKIIPWNKIEIHEYFHYFVIYSTENLEELNQAYYYRLDWNCGILFSTIKILKKSC